jgi:arsenate reductase (thioredoxin)
MKEKVLFVCVHNSARSQMAEAWLKQLAGNRFEVYSAGIEPGELNPIVVAAMAEVGIDISGKKTKSIAELLAAGHQFDYAITVCDDAQAESCPIFPGAVKRLHWSIPDPHTVLGTAEEKLIFVRGIREQIRQLVLDWCDWKIQR